MAGTDTTYVNYQLPPVYAENSNDINILTYRGRSPNFGTTTGTANIYTLNLINGSNYTSPTIGDTFVFRVNIANTAASSITLVNNAVTMGTYALTKDGVALSGGELVVGIFYTMRFNGAGFSIDSDPQSGNNTVKTTGDQVVAGIKNFTSSPLVPTQSFQDSSTKAVNSAWVKTAGNLYGPLEGFSANVTLTNTDFGKFITLVNATTFVVTLPDLTSGVTGSSLLFENISSSVPVTVTCQSGQFINIGGGVSSIVVQPGEILEVTTDGSSSWYQTGRYTKTDNTPVGNIIMYAKSTPPTGYLECNNAAVSRTTYSTLFTTIGTTYGAGDGSTTFNLPDMRGYFPRGWDDGAGIDPARAFGSTQTDAFASHTHNQVSPSSGTGGSYLVAQSASGSGTLNATGPTPTTATGGTETRPKNVALLFCIKY